MGVNITKEQAIDLVKRGLLKPEDLAAFDAPQDWGSVASAPVPMSKGEHTAAHRYGHSKYGRQAAAGAAPATKQNKYHNHKLYEYEDGAVSRDKNETAHGSVIDTFDSEKEYKRWKMLQMLERAGGIESLEKQKRFTLQDSFEYNGKKIRAITYVADFWYFNKKDEVWVVEDVKGSKATQTKDFNIKKKMFMFRYPDIRFVIIED